jgi:carbonic anhydrase
VQAGRGPAASATILGIGFTVDEFAAVLLLLVFGISTIVVLGHQDCGAIRMAMRAWNDAVLPGGATRAAVEHAMGSIVHRAAQADSIEAVTSAHIVDTGLALLERSPAVSRRVDERQCGIVCATTNPEDGRLVALATIGAVGGAEDSLLECI